MIEQCDDIRDASPLSSDAWDTKTQGELVRRVAVKINSVFRAKLCLAQRGY